jgi:hypothetical protein
VVWIPKRGWNITKRGVPRMVSCFYSSSFCRRGRGSQQKRQGTWRFPTSGPMSHSRGLYKKSGPTQVRAYTLTILSQRLNNKRRCTLSSHSRIGEVTKSLIDQGCVTHTNQKNRHMVRGPRPGERRLCKRSCGLNGSTGQQASDPKSKEMKNH